MKKNERDMSICKSDGLGLLVLVAITLTIIFVLMLWGTLTSFVPAVQEHNAAYESMQEELDQVYKDLTKTSEAIENWDGIQ